MRFVLTDESWFLDALSASEWHLLCELLPTAAGDNFKQSTRDRLFPSPLANDTLADEDSLEEIDDWNNFVRPDLDEGFADARAVVEADLETVESFAAEVILEPEQVELAGGEKELRRVVVPLENTDAWYSTLNQARLLMNEEYDLADGGDRFMIEMQGPDAVDQDRMLLLAQYEMYSVVQSILVENVMNS